MSHLSQYLKALMADVTLTNAEVLGCRELLATVTSTNGLSSVKLHRIRQALEREGAPIAEAFREIDERHAQRGDDGAALVQKGADGADLRWLRTRTPAYVPDPEKREARLAECAELDTGKVTLHVPLLNEQDLAWITASEKAGVALAAFTEGV
jgi:hypothetical protein